MAVIFMVSLTQKKLWNIDKNKIETYVNISKDASQFEIKPPFRNNSLEIIVFDDCYSKMPIFTYKIKMELNKNKNIIAKNTYDKQKYKISVKCNLYLPYGNGCGGELNIKETVEFQ